MSSFDLSPDPRKRPLSPCTTDLDAKGRLRYERAHHVFPLQMSSVGPSSQSLLPPFPSRQYNQLPTPQSPNDFTFYVGQDSQNSPSNHEHVILSSRFETNLLEPRPILSPLGTKFTPDSSVPRSRMMTPDSSPPNPLWAQRSNGDALRTLSQSHLQSSPPPASPGRRKCSTDDTTMDAPMSSISPTSSRFSSPLIPRGPIASKMSSRRQSTSPPLVISKMDSPSIPYDVPHRPGSPALPLLVPTAEAVPSAGGEMERLRQVMHENRVALIREAEIRRPDYLKREKRLGANVDLKTNDDIYEVSIGITDSPSKGRRLKLFQETSEQSFEESLMAGGYGRYKTAEWVRQPQPLALAASNAAGPSNVVALLEKTQEVPMSERELKKRKRLEAFRRDEGPSSQISQLLPAMLEGKGRVLIDPTYEGQGATENDLLTKKRNVGRKKKTTDSAPKEEQRRILEPSAKQSIQPPNWIDHEFPWRLRTEEMARFQKVEEDHRLKLIEKYLGTDSDNDEDEVEVVGEGFMSAKHDGFSQIQQTRRGRGKMVPLAVRPYSADMHGTRLANSSEKKMFPCDPADARIALLAKKSVRTLSYRLQRKRLSQDEDGVVCVCDNPDDGRPLVQCDGCETWYHLQCIGIKDISELGREEDPWFCHACENKRSRASSLEPEKMLSSEPTFVPTDDEPQSHRSHDTPFFQPSSPYDSPSWSFGRVPRTPIQRTSDLDPPGLSSGSSYINSSRYKPSTPQHPCGVGAYGDNYNHPFEGSPFDPTSTPSRGIKFGAPFMTPKNCVWSTRPSAHLQTPSKPSGRTASLAGFGSFADDATQRGSAWFSPFRQSSAFDESPIGRSKSGEKYQGRYFESPLASRSQPFSLLEESPIVRTKGKEKL